MKCHEARETLNRVMDGRKEARAAAAMRHVESCAECREWRRGMQTALGALAASKAVTPSVDLSGAVMAALPARHPASLRAAPALSTRRLVLLMAGCWLLGAIMTAAGIGVWGYYFGGSPHEVAVGAKASAEAAGSVARVGLTTSSVLLSLAVNTISGVLRNGARGVVAFLIVDTLVLLLAAVLWRKRRMLAGPYSILS